MTKKNIIFLSVSLMLIILLGIGISYSMWNISVSQDTNNTAYTECFDLSITNKENNINLDNAYPISNDKGKSLTPYTFTVTNTCDITAQYNINLEVLNNSTLSSKFIDIMFEGNINLLSSYDTTDKVNNSSIESRKLTTGILKSNESKDYTLRLWIDYNTTLEDLNNEIKTFKSKIVVVGKPINYTGDTVFSFDYTGGEQTFIAPVSGTYRLETWGAQGGFSVSNIESNRGGYGGYSTGLIKLEQALPIYINVGGKGSYCKSTSSGKSYYSESESEGPTCGQNGGYNGGGVSIQYMYGNTYYGSGGGATHVSKMSGILKKLKNYKNEIIIISSGGGGASAWMADQKKYNYSHIGGDGGGVTGTAGSAIVKDREGFCTGGSQDSSGIGGVSQDKLNSNDSGFGLGGSNNLRVNSYEYGPGGGSGYYGGGTSETTSCGGSGYIGNTLLTRKVMYCYNCGESNEESTKTISTTCNEETPTSYCAKKGNGYARITLVSIDE